MRYYLGESGCIYGLESHEEAADWISETCTELSEQEAFERANPPLSQAAQISLAESQKKWLLAEAETVIKPLEYAEKLGIAMDDELAKLRQWQIYTVLLNRVDTTNAPHIQWPEPPQ